MGLSPSGLFMELCHTALVVLTAGRSWRMGRCKALVEVEGRPLLEHLLAAPLVREFGEVVVVLGHHADAVRPLVERHGYRHVLNPDPDRGRTSSIQAGLRALGQGVEAAFLQGVDHPIIRPQTYRALAVAVDGVDVAVPSYQGQNGHPPLVAVRIFPAIMAAAEDEPLRNLFHEPGVALRQVEVDDPGVLLNIDRPEDVQRLRRPGNRLPGH